MPLGGCNSSDSSETYTGEYHYANAWGGNDYGIKVNVTVNGDKIEKVEIAASDYVEVTDSWPDKATWNDGIAALLARYEGKTVSSVLAEEVKCGEDGTPLTAATEGYVAYDSDYLITGATQGSGRLLLAVQDALKKA